MRLTADPDKCITSGQCVLAVPEVFDQREEDGTVTLLTDDPPTELQGKVRQAAATCPARAITTTNS